MTVRWVPRFLLVAGVVLTLCAILLDVGRVSSAAHRTFRVALVCFGLLPVVVLRAAWREKVVAERAARGLCIHCGYDLRATSERCPECGNPTTREG